ncbi:putative oxidoreductase [Corynespora cassiicola Philippines]|uniref:Putative oxidoreductase n=1 Tax=Corynespora cassiicola Philippines TaxID=1448308 RepID=A0A2T2NEL3_CORCC|nr:putative oxidoreductase [Corynespora cassiicola Philippines]
MASPTIPVIDLSALKCEDVHVKQTVIAQIGAACRQSGFFQIVNHGIPEKLQEDLLSCSEELFALPLDIKEIYSKDLDSFNRGYERLRAQNFEKRTAGDLKEGFYFGLDLPASHPKVMNKTFGLGPNKYPQHVQDPARFKHTIDTYHALMRNLAEDIVRTLCKALGVEDSWIPHFTETPIATLRLLHYPPQPSNSSDLERGIGAHTDFGAITILLQDQVGGLQVLDRATSSWVDVSPTKNAFVVNLGNLMMRWTNDCYISNLHRVINKSGKERYSVPFFFSGNPDFLVKCFTRFKQGEEMAEAKYPPVTVGEWISGRYADTYGSEEGKAVGELSVAEAKVGIAQ